MEDLLRLMARLRDGRPDADEDLFSCTLTVGNTLCIADDQITGAKHVREIVKGQARGSRML
jgi:hypothetical protein